jgi:hypothetical protein
MQYTIVFSREGAETYGEGDIGNEIKTSDAVLIPNEGESIDLHILVVGFHLSGRVSRRSFMYMQVEGHWQCRIDIVIAEAPPDKAATRGEEALAKRTKYEDEAERVLQEASKASERCRALAAKAVADENQALAKNAIDAAEGYEKISKLCLEEMARVSARRKEPALAPKKHPRAAKAKKSTRGSGRRST